MSDPKILVVDDDVMLCRAVQRMLRPYEVTIVSGGAEALELVAKQWFDVILCDVMMPELTGPELYHKLAEVAPKLQERILFMTGGMLDRVAPLMAGVPERLVEKPFTRASIKKRIHEFLDGVPDAP